MKKINNEDFDSLDEVVGYLTILFNDWKDGTYLNKETIDEEQKHFNNAIKYIKDLGDKE